MMKHAIHFGVVAVLMSIALPCLKAQTLDEDFDPGIMYILRSEEYTNINFEEANEWKITFTDKDTLDNSYNSPVGFILQGGINSDSLYVPIQTVDSIVMYQPKPVMQDGVFELTREYFPYIVRRERSMKIYFDANIPLPLPKVGQRVVCNIFEEPLPNGFVGTVDTVYTQGNEIVVERRKNVGTLNRYYKSLLYSGGGAYTPEQDSAIAQTSRMYRVRRGVPVQKAPEWNFKATKNGVMFEAGWDPDGATEKFGSFEYKLDGELKFTTSAKVNTAVTNLSSAKIGLTMEYGAEGTLEESITVEAGDKISVPGLGVAKDFELPMGLEGSFALGMYLDWSAKAELVAKGELNASTTLNLELDKFDLKHSIEATPIDKAFKWGIDATMEGEARIILGIEGNVDLAGIAGAGFSFGLLYPEITGKLKSWYSSEEEYDFNKVTPAQLLSYYETFDEGNQITNGIGAYYNLEAGIDDITYEFEAEEIEKDNKKDKDEGDKKEEEDKEEEEEEEEEEEDDGTWLELSDDGMTLRGKFLGVDIEGKLSKDYKTWEITAENDYVEAKVENGKWIFTIKGVGAGIEGTNYWFNYDYHLVYGLNKETSKYTVGNTEGNNRKYGIQIKGENRVLNKQSVHLWIYDHAIQAWDKKKLGDVESLPKKPANFTSSVSLRRGGTYTVMPVYQVWNPIVSATEEFYMSDMALIDSMLIPYDLMAGARMKDFNTLQIVGSIDDLMLSDYKDGKDIEAGYTIVNKDGNIVYDETFDLSDPKLAIFDIDIDVTGWEPGEYKVILNQKVGDHEKEDAVPATFERMDMGAPILQEINHSADISFTKGLTFRADIMEAPDADDKFGFEILRWNTETVVAEKSALGIECMKDENTFELILAGTELTPTETYEVRAFTIRNQGKKLYSQDRYEFMAPSPISDVKALVEHDVVTLMAVVSKSVINPANPENIPSYVKMQFELVEKEKLIGDDWDLTDPDDIFQIDAAVLGTGDVWGLSRDVTELKDNTEYCFRVYIYISKDKLLYSDTQTFKTKDTYSLKYSTEVEARKATINAKCTDFAAKKDNARVRFYCSTSKSAVERGSESCTIVEDNTIEGQTASVLVENLEPETTYYYKGVLMFEEQGDRGALITKEKPGTVSKFTTPNPYEIETEEAVVEDAMVTLKATLSESAVAELASDSYNTIYAAFDLVSDEHKAELTKGTASEHVSRVTEIEREGTSMTVDVYLEPGTTYHYRALIYVDGKEYYGSTKSFTTLEYDGGLIPLVRKYRTNASAPWIPIIVKPEERHLAIPLKELIKE